MIISLQELDGSSIALKGMVKNIKFLTSKETKGRVSGSEGARVTADYLANQLSIIGAQPAGEDGYFSYLDIYAARLEGLVQLSIGNIVLQHRVDYGEVSRFSNPDGTCVNGELLVVRDGDDVEEEKLKGKVVLIPEKPKDMDLASTVKSAEEAGVLALLIEGGEPKWFNKSLHGAREKSIPVLRVRKSVVSKIELLQGETVTIKLPLLSEDKRCQNVLGILPGKDSTKTLILSAHYDHLGDDPSGFRYPGAIDNASGIAIILEIVESLKNKELPFTILFAFFTGEESGLLGAKHFVKNTKLPISAVINVDSIGFEPTLNRMRNGHKEPGMWLADLSADIIKRNNVDLAWIQGGEDSMAFQVDGISAIGLGQKPTDPNQRGIHTPEDTLEQLYLKPIEHAYKITSEIIDHLLASPELLEVEVNGE